MFADFMGVDNTVMTAVVTAVGGFLSTMAYKIWDRMGKFLDNIDARDAVRNETLQAIQIDSAGKTVLISNLNSGMTRIESEVGDVKADVSLLLDRRNIKRPSGVVSQVDATPNSATPVKNMGSSTIHPKMA